MYAGVGRMTGAAGSVRWFSTMRNAATTDATGCTLPGSTSHP